MWFLDLFTEPFFVVLVLIVVLALTYVARSSRRTRVVQVGEDLNVTAEFSDAEPKVFRAVASLKGQTVSVVGPGFYVVTQKRAHPLSIIPALLLFPIGLVFLFVRDDLVLNISVTPRPDGPGTTVRLLGRTEAQHLATLRDGLAAFELT